MENAQTYNFQTETQQLLQILIHSLYAEREVFLRELISNASDAITRLKYIQLTEKDIRDAEVEPGIYITVDKDAKTITITDNGIGMTADEIVENLGTIGHSGIKSFLDSVKESNANINDVIGQFGVGFYSAFMVADNITIESTSYRKEAQAVQWQSDGVSEYTIGSSEKTE
ncbi:MAG: ATP-binding protein, partial [Anaerolineae bacterium]|nr:ATP-binding protein [Anaerolineae bacterium]